MEDRYDKIIIGTGSDISDSGTHLAFISNRYNKTDLPTDLIIPGDAEIWLRFHTDISKTFRGFLIEITAGPDPFEGMYIYRCHLKGILNIFEARRKTKIYIFIPLSNAVVS